MLCDIREDRQASLQVFINVYLQIISLSAEIEALLAPTGNWNFLRFTRDVIDPVTKNFGATSKSTNYNEAIDDLFAKIEAQSKLLNIFPQLKEEYQKLALKAKTNFVDCIRVLEDYQSTAKKISSRWYYGSIYGAEDLNEVFEINEGNGKKIFTLSHSLSNSKIILQFDPSDFPFEFFINLPIYILHEYVSHVYRQKYKSSNSLSSHPSSFEDGWLFFIVCLLAKKEQISELSTRKNESFIRNSFLLDLQNRIADAPGVVGTGFQAAQEADRILGSSEFSDATKLIGKCQLNENEIEELSDEIISTINKASRTPIIAEGTIRLVFGENLIRIAENDFQNYHFEDCISSYELAATINPKLADRYYLLLGNQFMSTNNLEISEVAYTKSLRHNPNRWEALLGQSETLARRGMVYEGLEIIEKASQLAPENIDVWNQKGSLLIKIGKFNEALKEFGEVLKTEPSNQIAIKGKNISLERLGRTNNRLYR